MTFSFFTANNSQQFFHSSQQNQTHHSSSQVLYVTGTCSWLQAYSMESKFLVTIFNRVNLKSDGVLFLISTVPKDIVWYKYKCVVAFTSCIFFQTSLKCNVKLGHQAFHLSMLKWYGHMKFPLSQITCMSGVVVHLLPAELLIIMLIRGLVMFARSQTRRSAIHHA
jgi:hypothetical protein